jgi:amidase
MPTWPLREEISVRQITILMTLFLPVAAAVGQTEPFEVVETTVAKVHAAYRSGSLSSRQLVQRYLDRIQEYDQQGPNINSVITLNADALVEASRLDDTFQQSGFVGPLHGIPVMLKDQIDARGMPTTLGSVLFEDYYPDRDAFVTEQLRAAGAIILGKVTLGELAGGDTHGSLFGSTRNPYALDRTVGGSSGGSGASVAANFATIAVGQEGLASIRRPAAWNSLVGMRPTAGLVSRGGVFAGWPQLTGSLGPMARTMEDLVALLDVLVGYDPEDPITANGAAHVPDSYRPFLDATSLNGARLGIIRESIGINSEPESEDFAKVDAVFQQSISELRAAGAVIVDNIALPDMQDLLSKRSLGPTENEDSFQEYFSRSSRQPFESIQAMVAAPKFSTITNFAQARFGGTPSLQKHYTYLTTREELMTSVLRVMADHELDAIVYKAVEHQPTLIEDGVTPPFVNTKGVPHLNAFLVYVPAIVVPAGFTVDNLPVGLTFMGRPYADGKMIALAYSYEQATQHRRPPSTTPALLN